MKHRYEVEIKSLLGSKENADSLKAKLKAHDPNLVARGAHTQKNHYFEIPEDFSGIYHAVSPLLSQSNKKELQRIIASHVGSVSIRTRDADGKVFFILKASVGDDTSANGVSRIEFEALVHESLDELDARLLRAGAVYQAKWSRAREEYQSSDVSITIDKNAGYGFLAEFEQVVEDEKLIHDSRKALLALMQELRIEELPQDRLERMFAYYNKHWPDYYGTDKTFIIE